MLNLRIKFILLSHDVIWLNKTYGEYVSRRENTNSNTYILQYEYKSYNWDHVKIDSFKTEVKTENVKTEENIKTKKDSRMEEDV